MQCISIILISIFVVVCLVAKSRVWLFSESMDCNPPASSIHGISQARILEWVATFFSRGSYRPRDQTCVSCTNPSPPKLPWLYKASRIITTSIALASSSKPSWYGANLFIFLGKIRLKRQKFCITSCLLFTDNNRANVGRISGPHAIGEEGRRVASPDPLLEFTHKSAS